MEIDDFVKKAHENSLKHGFWDDIAVIKFSNINKLSNDYKQLINNAICTRLMLITGEVAEAMEGLRDGNKPYYKCNVKLNEIEFNALKEIANSLDNPLLQWIVENIKYFDPKENFKEELADVAIRLADLSGELSVDLQAEILKKMDKNKNRPYKHGKEF